MYGTTILENLIFKIQLCWRAGNTILKMCFSAGFVINKFFLNYYSMKKNRKKVTSGNFETKTKHIFIFL